MPILTRLLILIEVPFRKYRLLVITSLLQRLRTFGSHIPKRREVDEKPYGSIFPGDSGVYDSIIISD